MDQNNKLDFIISELQQMQHTFSSHLSSVENKVDGMQAQMTDMQGQIFDLQEDVSHLQEDVTHLQKDVSHLQEDVTYLQKDISHLRKDVSHLQEDVSDLREQVSENQFINALVNGQARIEEKVDKLQNSYRFLEEATARNWNDIIELKKAT